MKVLITTSLGQGLRPTDVCQTVDGELVGLGHIESSTDDEVSVFGMGTGNKTTTFTVIDTKINFATYAAAHLAFALRSGLLAWEGDASLFLRHALNLAELAKHYHPHQILEREGPCFTVRLRKEECQS